MPNSGTEIIVPEESLTSPSRLGAEHSLGQKAPRGKEANDRPARILPVLDELLSLGSGLLSLIGSPRSNHEALSETR